MSTTTLAPVQTDNAAWKLTRGGNFTASVLGDLFGERGLTDAEVDKYESLATIDRWTELKSGVNKGERKQVTGFKAHLREILTQKGVFLFGDTALKLIASKAAERLGGTLPTPYSYDMTRGTLLEPAARLLLSRYWTEIEGATYLPLNGHRAGATPDGYVGKGSSTWDCKCPANPADVLLFAREVPNEDFEALEAWNKTYAWQQMMQAKCAGTKYGTLTYFTDMLPLHKISDEERQEVQEAIDFWAERLTEQTGRTNMYQFATDGFAHASRRFELTAERSTRIDMVLTQAEALCVEMMQEMKLLNK